MKYILYLFLGIFCLFLLAETATAQKKKIYARPKKKPNKAQMMDAEFSATQWWIGARFGGGVSQASPDKRFTTFSSTTGIDPAFYEKEYEDFKKVGAEAGMEITLYHRGFSFSFQPNYRRQRFIYANEFRWTDQTNAENILLLKYDQDHRLDYVELPLLVRYEFLQNNLRPFVQLGGYYGTLINAQKAVAIEGVDFASGAESPFQSEEILLGAKDLFVKNAFGLIGGVGVNWNVSNFRLSLAVNYRYGLTNITNAPNRYRENQLTGIGDALDDMKLRNISATFGILFPMRFLVGKDFKAVN
jgi:hypothetical protein